MHGITEQVRGEMYRQLAVMEEAGALPDHALKVIAASANNKLATRAAQAAHLASQGRAIDEAGKRSGLFTVLDAKLLHAALMAGSPAPAYRRLARFYEQRASYRRTIMSRLMLPSVMLLAAIFLAPLPQLFMGELTLVAYLLKTFGVVLYFVLALLAFLKLPTWLRDGWLKWLNPENAFDRLLIKVPLFGRAEMRRQRTYFLKVLCLLLESGIPLFDAVPLAADTLSNRHLRANFTSLAELLESGETLAGAFARSPYMDGGTLLIAETGEATGDSGQVICRYAEMEQQRLQQYYDDLTTWIPRLIYILVLILMAWEIIVAFPGPVIVGQAIFQLTHL